MQKVIIYQVDFHKISADSKINLVYSLLYYVFCSRDIKSNQKQSVLNLIKLSNTLFNDIDYLSMFLEVKICELLT